MGYTTNQLYNKVYERVSTIHDIFKGFFGEEHVDLHTSLSDTVLKLGIENSLETQGIPIDYSDATYDIEYPVTDTMVCELQSKYAESKATIYVWWSEVVITNENNKSTKIQDLYAKIEINLDGTIPLENHGFLLNRATYTRLQFLSNYMHSHVSAIPKSNFSDFQQPCLGKGPIKNTILSLKTTYDETIWMLFCQELSMYVTVESLSGIPYHYLEKLHINKYPTSDYTGYSFKDVYMGAFPHFGTDHLSAFIKHYLQHGHLSLSYINGKFTCSMPYPDFIIDISNAFIDYYNEHLASTDSKVLIDLYKDKFLNVLVLDNGTFYREENHNINPNSLDLYQDKYVLTFKGKEIKTTILDSEDSDNNNHSITVLNHKVAMFILRNILRTINYRYRNEHNNTARGEEASSTTPQRIIYI